MTPDQPPTDAELDELDAFLMSEATPEECMDIAMMDGFFAALAIGPNTLMPSQWLPALWGETETDEMIWESAAQMQHILGIVMRFYNERMQDLQEGIDEYDPLIYTREHEGQTIPIIDEWCMGFVRAIELDPAGWQPLVETIPDGAGALLTPIFLYGTEAGWEELEKNENLAGSHQEFAAAIGTCVIGIRDYWLPRRKEASTYRRTEAKVGRNDPCPCGSGRKYKKCCGAGGETMH